MLVLSRKMRESVVIGDEVRVTVEEIRGGEDGQRILGATVRLGFQSPRHVSIHRSELLARRASGGSGFGASKRPPTPGKLVEISDAQVRLRIQTPRKVPVCCNGAPAPAVESKGRRDRSDAPSSAVHSITCRKEDRITICHNITIAALDFRRFIPAASV